MATTLVSTGIQFPDDSIQTTAASVVANGTIFENSQTISQPYTLTSGKSGMSVGPITINSGVTVTVPSGSRWVVL